MNQSEFIPKNNPNNSEYYKDDSNISEDFINKTKKETLDVSNSERNKSSKVYNINGNDSFERDINSNENLNMMIKI